MLAALATTANATAFGLTVTDAALLRASTRVRGFVGQDISAGTSTVTVRGPRSRLPQRPVTAITSITDEDSVVLEADDYVLSPGGVLDLPSTKLFTVVYAHGWATIPDAVIEVVCTVAARLGATDATVASGVTQEQSGSASQTFGWDAWRATGGLAAEEKAVLTRLFPKLPKTLVLSP